MDWSDYLVWRSDARLKPLIYSHVHLADPQVWNDYAKIFVADGKSLDLLRSHDIRYVVASRERNAQLAGMLLKYDAEGQGGVRVIYRDQKALIAELTPRRK